MSGLDMTSILPSIVLFSIVTCVFFYMWLETRRKHLLYWAVALLNNLLVLVASSMRITFPHLDPLWRIITDALASTAGVHTAMGACHIAKKPDCHKRTLAIFPILGTTWSLFANLVLGNPLLASIPVFMGVSIAIVGAGFVFIKVEYLSKFPASKLTGWTLVVWGVLNVTYPMAHSLEVVSPLAHYFADALALLMSFAMLLVSVQEMRSQMEKEQERLSVTLSSIGDAVIAVDRDSRITVLNPIAEALTGWKQEEAVGRPLEDVFKVINEQTRKPALNLVERVLVEGKIIGLANHTVLISRDGVERSIADSAAPIHDESGAVNGVILVFRDVTEERLSERKLRDSEERFRAIAENTNDVIFRIKLVPEAKFEYLSPAVVSVTGYSAFEMCADFGLALSCIHPDDLIMLKQMGNGDHLDRPTVLRWNNRNGNTVWTEQRFSPIYDSEGCLIGLDGIARDVTERKLMEARVRYMSLHDPLTGIYNRAYFEEEMKRLDGAAARDARPVTILSTDVDGVKLVNDTKGHKEGDDLLKAYADLLRATFTGKGLFARIGGDEFAVLLRNTDAQEGIECMRLLEEAIAAYNLKEPSTPLSVSMGSATSDGHEPLEEVLSRADRSLFNAKLHASPSNKSGLVKSLLTALAAKDFVAEGHVSRVTEVACRLGEAVGLTKKELLDLELLAEVHDLGKVGIPDRILFKPGPLNAEERAEMQKHPEIGYRIAKSSLELSHIATLILHHHEWWNGEGYPSKLKGESIPIACRIITIADAYDAIRSARPYKEARTHAEAMAELKRCAGTQFDPHLIEVFESIADEVAEGAARSEAAATASLVAAQPGSSR